MKKLKLMQTLTFLNLMIMIHKQKVMMIAMLELKIFPVPKNINRMMKQEVIQVSYVALPDLVSSFWRCQW